MGTHDRSRNGKVHMIELCGCCLGPLTGRYGDHCELCDAQRLGNHVLRVKRGSRQHIGAILTDMKRHAQVDETFIREFTRRLDYA